MEELERRKELLKVLHCFRGPVRKSFLFTYYNAYTQDTDVHQYSVNNGLEGCFSSSELSVIQNEKKPNRWPLELVYKVIRVCCASSLSTSNEEIWSKTVNVEQNGVDAYKIEEILTTIINSYKQLIREAHSMSVNQISRLIDNLNELVCLLIDKVSEELKSDRGLEEKSILEEEFAKIKKGNLFYDESQSVADLVRVETDFKSALYREWLHEEVTKCDEFNWHLETFTCDHRGKITAEQYNNAEEVDAKFFVEIIRESERRICWISGEHGIGKSTFGAALVSARENNASEVPGLEFFSTIIVISLVELQNSTFGDGTNVFRLILPLTSQFISKDKLMEWLENEQVLVVFDDVNRLSECMIQEVFQLVDAVPTFNAWFLGRLSSLLKYITQPKYAVNANFFELKGLKEKNILKLSESLENKLNDETLTSKLKNNISRLGSFLKYPTIFHWTCELWRENPKAFQEIYSASDLMWQILAWNVKKRININIKVRGKTRKKFLKWLMLAGELALYSLKADHRLDKVLLNDLATEIATLFSEKCTKVLEFICKPIIVHSFDKCFTSPASPCKPFLEYLSSWYFVDELLHDKPLNQLTEGLVNKLPLILFAAGHMERFQEQGSVSIPDERRVIKALVNYKPNSYDDFSFIQKFVAEMRCIKRIVQIVIDETEYNEEWFINLSNVQHKSLQVLLNHVSPNRLIFLEDKLKTNHELSDAMDFVCRVEISVWLDSTLQFSFGSKKKFDNVLKLFLRENVIPKLDLLSGCLSSSVMQELCTAQATRHLVLLRLKVDTDKMLRTALSLPKQLPNLLWLELKIDMNVQDIKIGNIRPTEVPLFDVYIRNLDDCDVTFAAQLLTAMQRRFTGIHLEDTSMTPEGVYTLLKELGKRKSVLRGLEEDIVKFRRWYYCCLSNIPKEQLLTEQDCIDIIGHDDRGFFSDHYVSSSQFVTSIEAWNLRSYLESQPNIIKFCYEASNIMFSKNLDGEVTIEFKGLYKESIENKMMNGKDPALKEEIQKEVLAFY